MKNVPTDWQGIFLKVQPLNRDEAGIRLFSYHSLAWRDALRFPGQPARAWGAPYSL